MVLELVEKFYFPEFILDFLHSPILSFLPWADWWLAFHFLTGALLIFLIGKNRYIPLIFLLVGYEVFEGFLFERGLAIPEEWYDATLDVIFGFFGYFFASKLPLKKKFNLLDKISSWFK